MARLDLIEMYRGSIDFLESVSCAHYRCCYFRSAYMCRKHLEACGFYDAKVVRIGDGSYLPMSPEDYRVWLRLRRELRDLRSEPEYI